MLASGVQKSLGPVSQAIKFCTMAPSVCGSLSVGLVSCHLSGTKYLDVAAFFLICAPLVYHFQFGCKSGRSSGHPKGLRSVCVCMSLCICKGEKIS